MPFYFCRNWDSACLTRRFVISPPTDPFCRADVSPPSLTPNSVAISSFMLFSACSAPGTTSLFLFGMCVRTPFCSFYRNRTLHASERMLAEIVCARVMVIIRLGVMFRYSIYW